ncbi:hypothetical protein HNQ99_000370 [Rhizorhapis suberifaciens]|uniref:Uncharacterized protein n=1 Tax=Rhizorhapis suberifaciens TaxID=13656 RepID=A0A840HR50_9SPHN|nr:hypothetical protein [Rhizorhapis suberifaciens]MBB4640090.1 hypothetical protein [Rhizorhapis suberifaciens]
MATCPISGGFRAVRNGLSIRGIRRATYRVVTGTWVRGVCIFDHCSPSNKTDACEADSRITPSCALGQ